MEMPFSLSGEEGRFEPDFQQFHARNGRGLALCQIHNGLEGQAFAVHELDGVAQLLLCDGYVKFFFQIGDEQLKLVPPVSEGVIILHLWQLQQKNGFVGCKQLVHFLFAVTGGVGHHHISGAQVGATVFKGKAEAALDERAKSAGQHFFCRGDGIVAGAAQRNGDGPGGHRYFRRAVQAVLPHNFFAFPLGLLHCQSVFFKSSNNAVKAGTLHDAFLPCEVIEVIAVY